MGWEPRDDAVVVSWPPKAGAPPPLADVLHQGTAPGSSGAQALRGSAKSPVEVTAELLRGRHTVLILWHLFWGGKRFYQLLREIEGVSRKALAQELEDLEGAGIVARRVRRSGPSKVEYVLTPLGESLKPIVGAMYEWGLLVMGLRQAPGSAGASIGDGSETPRRSAHGLSAGRTVG